MRMFICRLWRDILSSATTVRTISEDIAGILGSSHFPCLLASDWSIHRVPGFWLVTSSGPDPDVSVSPLWLLRRLSGVTITRETRQITWKLPALGTVRLNMPGPTIRGRTWHLDYKSEREKKEYPIFEYCGPYYCQMSSNIDTIKLYVTLKIRWVSINCIPLLHLLLVPFVH